MARQKVSEEEKRSEKISFRVTPAERERVEIIKARWRAWLDHFKGLGISSQSGQLAEAERMGRLDEFKQLAAEVRELTAGLSY